MAASFSPGAKGARSVFVAPRLTDVGILRLLAAVVMVSWPYVVDSTPIHGAATITNPESPAEGREQVSPRRARGRLSPGVKGDGAQEVDDEERGRRRLSRDKRAPEDSARECPGRRGHDGRIRDHVEVEREHDGEEQIRVILSMLQLNTPHRGGDDEEPACHDALGVPAAQERHSDDPGHGKANREQLRCQQTPHPHREPGDEQPGVERDQ